MRCAGISAADQAKLFQEFQQADNAITKKKGGTGLGLAISKRIIEMHGGRIWVVPLIRGILAPSLIVMVILLRGNMRHRAARKRSGVVFGNFMLPIAGGKLGDMGKKI
jgi:signal transduction histidine kinase